VTRHQNGISALAPQPLLRGEKSDGVAKMSAIFSGYIQAQSRQKYVLETTSVCKNLEQLGESILLQKLQTVLYFLTSKIVKPFYTFLLQNCQTVLYFLTHAGMRDSAVTEENNTKPNVKSVPLTVCNNSF